jgi:hypothetical protein
MSERAYTDPGDADAFLEDVQVLPFEGVTVVLLALPAQLPEFRDVERGRVAAVRVGLHRGEEVQEIYAVG